MIPLFCGKMKQFSSIDLICESHNNSSNRCEPSWGRGLPSGLRQMTLHTWCLLVPHSLLFARFSYFCCESYRHCLHDSPSESNWILHCHLSWWTDRNLEYLAYRNVTKYVSDSIAQSEVFHTKHWQNFLQWQLTTKLSSHQILNDFPAIRINWLSRFV